MKDCGDCGSSHAFANVSLLLAVFLKPLRLHTCCSLHGGGHLSLCLDSLESAYLSCKTQLHCHFYYEAFYDCPLQNGSRLCSTNMEQS